MKPFDIIIGKRINKIQRIDSQIDYEFYTAHALILTLEKLDEKLVLIASDNGTSVEIRLTCDFNLKGEFRLEFEESVFNALKPEDELNQLRNQKITALRIAEFIEPEIFGDNFVIKQGKIAGIKFTTANKSMLFQNNCGGWIDFDDAAELQNKHRWIWK